LFGEAAATEAGLLTRQPDDGAMRIPDTALAKTPPASRQPGPSRSASATTGGPVTLPSSSENSARIGASCSPSNELIGPQPTSW